MAIIKEQNLFSWEDFIGSGDLERLKMVLKKSIGVILLPKMLFLESLFANFYLT